MKTLLIVALIITGCSNYQQTTNTKNANTNDVSIIAIISNPDKFHNKHVHVEGYFTLQHEEYAIYFSKSDYENGLFKNGIFLDISKDFVMTQNIDKPFNGYIAIEGIFNKKKLGSNDSFSGTLEEISYIYRKPIRKKISD